MQSYKEYDSEFCNVKYIDNENVVLLTWKKVCRDEDYKKPALFALNLLKNCPDSDLFIDARNGFECESSDANWSVTNLVPQLAETECLTIIFIVKSLTEKMENLDEWTKVFEKFFKVARATSFQDAIYKRIDVCDDL